MTLLDEILTFITGPDCGVQIIPEFPEGREYMWRLSGAAQERLEKAYLVRNPNANPFLDKIDMLLHPLLAAYSDRSLDIQKPLFSFMDARNALAGMEGYVYPARIEQESGAWLPLSLDDALMAASWEILLWEFSKARENNALKGVMAKTKTLIANGAVPPPTAETIPAWDSFLRVSQSYRVLPHVMLPNHKGPNSATGWRDKALLPLHSKVHLRDEKNRVSPGVCGVFAFDPSGPELNVLAPAPAIRNRSLPDSVWEGMGSPPLYYPFTTIRLPLPAYWARLDDAELTWGLHSLAQTYKLHLRFNTYEDAVPWVHAYATAYKEYTQEYKRITLRDEYQNVMEFMLQARGLAPLVEGVNETFKLDSLKF